MSAQAYFILRSARSLNTRGISGRKYQFKKDTPTLVTSEPDIDNFRSREELVETDNTGQPLTKRFNGKKPLSYTSIAAKKAGLFGANKANEAFLEDAFKSNNEDEDAFKSNNEDEDAISLESEKNEEETEKEKKPKKPIKIKDEVQQKPSVKEGGKHKCLKCGKKFSEEKDLNKHLELHDEEDD